jgi:hypothetical protein
MTSGTTGTGKKALSCISIAIRNGHS